MNDSADRQETAESEPPTNESERGPRLSRLKNRTTERIGKARRQNKKRLLNREDGKHMTTNHMHSNIERESEPPREKP